MISLSFAPILYRNVLGKVRSPIKKVKFRQCDIRNGQAGFEAYAYLHDELLPHKRTSLMYGRSHGTGSHIRKSIACYKAISEALERWAAYRCAQDNGSEFGFDIENSTTGMASFPSVFSMVAQRNATLEALERWCLVEWWLGNLPCENIEYKTSSNIKAIVIVHPLKNVGEVVILWQPIDGGSYSYGFAAHLNRQEAAKKAEIELFRNKRILENKNKLITEKHLTDRNERRLMYFSKESGYSDFKYRVNESLKLLVLPEEPRKLVDHEIKGQWSKYSRVWRTLFEQSSTAHQSDSNDFFLF